MVRSADVVLLSGEHIRFHDDGRLDVPGEGTHRRTLDREESTAWFLARGLDPVTLAELAGSEGVFGLLTHLTVRVEPRPEIGAFLLAFDSKLGAFEAARWVADEVERRFGAPANLKAMSGEHLHHVRRVWADEDARAAHRGGSQLTDGTRMPWRRLVGPEALGAAPSGNGANAGDSMPEIAPAVARAHEADAGSVLFVDFFDLDAARAFAASLGEMPGAPRLLVEESARFARERFRPQQTKRLGPGLVAAEIVMPADQVTRFLPKAARLVRNAGSALDAEVYYLADGEALVIGAYLTDQRRGDFWLDLMIAPALVDLAMRGHRGRPYVLGRWQSAWARHKFGAAGVARLSRIKQVVDDSELVNRGVLLGLRLHGRLGRLMTASFVPGVSLLSRVYGFTPLRPLVSLARGLFATRPGPGHGRGAPLPAGPRHLGVAAPDPGLARPAPPTLEASARAIHCVNCGECNSVCPIFHEARIRLPQTLTHVAEAAHGGVGVSETGSVLLDLCMRCGNCEEVCQAGIPHLELYEGLQRRADATRPPDRERHTAIVAAVRGSQHYTREFLQIRPGGYVKRAPASLPGVARYVLIRAENEAGPASSCIHCGACVPVCPTNANHEFEAQDPRWITTVQERCVGCGTCVEVCPANLANGGRTLRVMEAPTLAWTEAVAEFERTQSRESPQPIP
jgi:ferredoxin/FAD/FMN-containing dehydrogenase